MPQKPSAHDQQMAEIAWSQAVLSVIDTALRTVDEPDEQLVARAEILAGRAASGKRGGPHEENAYRVALAKVLYMATEGLYAPSPGQRDLAAVAQEECEPVREVLETALTGFPSGMHELTKALVYPADSEPPHMWAIARAAIHAVRMVLRPLGDETARWEAAAEIMAKTGR